MEKDKAECQQMQTVPIVMMQHPMECDDEINLLDLWRTLLRRKGVIIMVTSLITLAGIAYALLAAPVYKAESYLLPPAVKDIQVLNSQALNGHYTPGEVYAIFIQHLKSRALQRHFFYTEKLADSLAPHHNQDRPVEQIFDDFNKNLSVGQMKKSKTFMQVVFEGKNAKLAAKLVNKFISEANAATVKLLVQNMTSQIEGKKRALREQIVSKRKTAELLRQDRLAQLEDAIGIAEKVGLKEQETFSPMTDNSTTVFNIARTPLYLRGSKALRAEKESLIARKNNAPFIQGLRGLQERLDTLTNSRIDPTQIFAVRVDQPALVPYKRIKPKRKLIVLLSLIGGLMLGVFSAFFMEFIANARQE